MNVGDGVGDGVLVTVTVITGEGVIVAVVVGVLLGPAVPTGVGAMEQPVPFCQFWIETDTVFAALPVMVRYIAPVESFATVKLFSCPPLPLNVLL